MSDRERVLQARVAELRDAFDRAFASPAALPREEQGLVAIRAAGERFALRLSEIGGLTRCGRIVPMPSRSLELLGLAGIRGTLVAAFSLARLLGYPRDPEPPSWLVLCGDEPVGLAFAAFDGHVRLAAHELEALPEAQARSPHLRQLVSIAGAQCPLVSIPSILARLAEPQRNPERQA